MFKILASLTLLLSLNAVAGVGYHRYECTGDVDQKLPTDKFSKAIGTVKLIISSNPYHSSNTGTGQLNFILEDDNWQAISFEKLSASGCNDKVWRKDGVVSTEQCNPAYDSEIETTIGSFKAGFDKYGGIWGRFELNETTLKEIQAALPPYSKFRDVMRCLDKNKWEN